MLKRWPVLLLSALFLGACFDNDLKILDRNSLGISQPLIEIYSPLGNASLPANTPFVIDYAVLRSENGHHVKIRINEQRPVTVVKRRGKHRVKGLPAGEHRIQITEYSREGRETGGHIILRLSMVAPTVSDHPAADENTP